MRLLATMDQNGPQWVTTICNHGPLCATMVHYWKLWPIMGLWADLYTNTWLHTPVTLFLHSQYRIPKSKQLVKAWLITLLQIKVMMCNSTDIVCTVVILVVTPVTAVNKACTTAIVVTPLHAVLRNITVNPMNVISVTITLYSLQVRILDCKQKVNIISYMLITRLFLSFDSPEGSRIYWGLRPQ